MKDKGSTPQWRGSVNEILYGTILRSPADARTVENLVDSMLDHRYFNRSIDEYSNAVQAALRSGEHLAFDSSQDEESVRDLLARFVASLDTRRPWPDRPYTALGTESSTDLSAAPAIGVIPLRRLDVQHALRRVFDDGNDGQGHLLLRLAGGQEVALRAPSSFSDAGVVLLSKSEPETTRSAFTAATGLEVNAYDPAD